MIQLPKVLIKALTNTLFPYFCYLCGREGHTWCRSRNQASPWPLCFHCRRAYHPQKSQPGCQSSLPLVWFGPYHDLRLRSAIYDWKYTGYWTISQDWARGLADQLDRYFPQEGLLVPIPLHWQRRLARGYNQAAILTDQISRLIGWPCHDLLVRTRPTAVQAKLLEEERSTNVAGAFTALTQTSKNETQKRKLVWLIDDVATTGATLLAAQKTLEKNGWLVAGMIVVAATGGITSAPLSTDPSP